MKHFRELILFALCTVVAFGAVAEDPDPLISSIDAAYEQAHVAMKKNKSMGNEMVTKITRSVRGKGKTTETIRFYYNTVEGTYLGNDGSDSKFFYHPLYFITRSYNIGKQKYYEEYLFDDNQNLLYALTQDYDENGKRIERRFYYDEGTLYADQGPEPEPQMDQFVLMQANELRHGFDWLIQNPKE